MIFDLHTHTTASDGILRPKELVSRAKLHGVDVLAITDHDTMTGYNEAEPEARVQGLVLVAGIEFSCQWQSRGIHIVGLGLDPTADPLLDLIAKQESIRRTRGEQIAERLAKVGCEGALEGARAIAGRDEVGRPHFAQFMVNTGFAKSTDQAFKRYLGNGKIGDVKQDWPEIKEAVAAILSSGGRPVFAHPDKYDLTRTKLRACLQHFKEVGGEALEVISGLQSPSVTQSMVDLCRRFELLASCGSDFHQPGAGWQALGAFGPLPETVTPVWHDWAQAA